MTKHLRIFMLNLLVLISAAVMAQTTVDFSNGLPSDWSKLAGTVAKQTYEGKTAIQLQKGASISSPAMAEAATKLVVTTTRSSNGKAMTIAYKIGEADAVVFKTFNATEVAQASWKEYTVDVPTEAQVAGCKYIFTTNTASYYISQIKFVAASTSTTPTSLSFNGTDVTLTEGKTDAGADFTGYTATVTDNIAGTITYAASGDAVATVNETTGAVTVNATTYGTTTITATFTPADPTQYSGSTATYQITNKKAVDLSEIVSNLLKTK